MHVHASLLQEMLGQSFLGLSSLDHEMIHLYVEKNKQTQKL